LTDTNARSISSAWEGRIHDARNYFYSKESPKYMSLPGAHAPARFCIEAGPAKPRYARGLKKDMAEMLVNEYEYAEKGGIKAKAPE
jgi:hypothetical protein